jgi:hypothetical protein
MDEPQADAVTYAVERCLKFALGSTTPTFAAAGFIHFLKTGNTFNNGEIAEITRRVMVMLSERRKNGDDNVKVGNAKGYPVW